MNGNDKKLLLNILNIFSFILTSFSGLLIQSYYHMSRYPDSYVVMGYERASWHSVHIIAAGLLLSGFVCHFIINIKSFKYLLLPVKKKLSGRLRISRTLLIIMLITFLTGLTSYCFYLGENLETRHHIIEIHDKLGIIITIFLLIHFIQHIKQLFRSAGKLIQNRSVNKLL